MRALGRESEIGQDIAFSKGLGGADYHVLLVIESDPRQITAPQGLGVNEKFSIGAKGEISEVSADTVTGFAALRTRPVFSSMAAFAINRMKASFTKSKGWMGWPPNSVRG